MITIVPIGPARTPAPGRTDDGNPEPVLFRLNLPQSVLNGKQVNIWKVAEVHLVSWKLRDIAFAWWANSVWHSEHWTIVWPGYFLNNQSVLICF